MGCLATQWCHGVPFAEDDVVVGIAQAGDRHVGQLELLQLSHDCGETVRQDTEMRGRQEREYEQSQGHSDNNLKKEKCKMKRNASG